ncbi:hypothetical protein QNG97_gp30 [Escherichia phage MLP1]|uniref:Uncharacterized protein n=1 Tax=Escherichia phage MLP1 TaxID=2875839 RepID=A0AAE9C586_9CAUD|nr:hypothetical protein QNG97_gp30 [Escherichia phage MLP1]UEN68364.1 hypothetical protein [Escherichia phage MLP1]
METSEHAWVEEQFRIIFLLHTWLLELCLAKDREFNDCHIITTLCV